jgi:hypothetical protein
MVMPSVMCLHSLLWQVDLFCDVFLCADFDFDPKFQYCQQTSDKLLI